MAGKSKSDIQPLFDNVLIKPLQAETQTAGGIYLPENIKEKPQIGEVMAIGPGLIHPKGEVEKMGRTNGRPRWGYCCKRN